VSYLLDILGHQIFYQLENSILELLVDNLTRLNEKEESDRQGVFHILGTYSLVLSCVRRRLIYRHFRERPWVQSSAIHTPCAKDKYLDLVA
jgi:hypothetical protein